MKNQKSILPISDEVEINRLVNQAIGWEAETEILLDRIGVQPVSEIDGAEYYESVTQNRRIRWHGVERPDARRHRSCDG